MIKIEGSSFSYFRRWGHADVDALFAALYICMTRRPCELIPEDIPQGVVPLHFLKTSGVCIELANTLFLLELK